MMGVVAITLLLISHAARADGVGDEISKMQPVLDNLYDEMMPLCSQLISVSRGIAGFAALFYIGSRVWRHLANAEPIDFYPLFRPFCLGFCISFFPLILGMINGLLQPTVTATAEMVEGSNQAIAILLRLKAEAIKQTDPYKMYVGQNGEGDKQRWLKYLHGLPNTAHDIEEGMFEGIGTDVSFAMAKAGYRFRNNVKEWMSEILNVLFQGASLCVNTIRTFQMVVLSILGPLVFGLAVFDGFQHTLTGWLAKYLNIFLWLPVCNIFGAIIGKLQEQMLKLDLSQISLTGDTFFSASDTGYLIFLIIGIVGYFTVPTVAGLVINVGQSGALVEKMNSMVQSGGGAAISGGGAAISAGAGNLMTGVRGIANAGQHIREGMSGNPEHSGKGVTGAVGRAAGGAGAYMHDKLSGKDNS